MKSKSNVRGDFKKMFESLCGRYAPYAVWQDYITLVACSISSAVDMRYKDDREALFGKVCAKYSDDECGTMRSMYGAMVLDMTDKPNCDYLGELYMQMGLGNKNAGQFFTPYSVCAAMAHTELQKDRTLELIHQNGYITINDPSCGAGATLVAAAYTLRDHGIDYHQSALFVGQDIDFTVGMMCYIQLSLLGCAGYVYMADTLSYPMTGHVLYGEPESRDTWYTPMYFSDVWAGRRLCHQMDAALSSQKNESNARKEDATCGG